MPGETGVELRLRYGDGGSEHAAAVKAVLERVAKESGHVAARTPWPVVRDALEDGGYELRELPTADFQTTVTIQVPSGRAVGTSTALHEYASTDDVPARVFAAIAGMGESVSGRLVQSVGDALVTDDHARAAAEFENWQRQGGFLFGVRPPALTAVRQIDVTRLDRTARRQTLEMRIAAASVLHDYGAETEEDISAVLREFEPEMDGPTRANMTNARGLVALRAGRRETAYSLWKSVASPESLASTEDRAWAHRNISVLLSRADPEAARHAEVAADAFLQSGNRLEAARSVLRYADCVLPRAPEDALRAVDEAITWFDSADALARDIRAGLQHSMADSLRRLGRYREALETCCEAARRREGIHGAEASRAASLHLASIIAHELGDHDLGHSLESSAKRLLEALHDPAVELELHLADLLRNFDAAQAARLAELARNEGNWRLLALVGTTAALFEGTHDEKLTKLEEALALLRAHDADDADLVTVLNALGRELLTTGHLDRALVHFRDANERDPLDAPSRQNVASLLCKTGRWSEAVVFFERQRGLFGDLPDILHGLGRSLLESGDPSRAAPVLFRAKQNFPDGHPARDLADKLLALAFERGARPVPLDTERPVRGVTRAELEQCLTGFGEHVKAQNRMGFWRPDGSGGHKWVEAPERRAQDLLRAHLHGRLAGRVEVLEELAVGAGRLDVYVVANGGFRAVLELKMLGAGYSSTYAFSGSEQVTHYMENKQVNLGYLVLFDARTRDFGTGLPPTVAVGAHTVRVVFIDVRPEVKAK